MNFTVCILTAGIGSRMGNIGKRINKSLIQINNKAAISHIIDKFPMSTEFVIGLGYLATQVKQYLKIAHPNNKFKYVFIKNYNKKGSGPGLSLLYCQKYLNKPFFFVSCDTIWLNKINFKTNCNWIMVDKMSTENSKDYMNVKIENHKVVKIMDKKLIKYPKNNIFSFSGLNFIHDFNLFWSGLKNKKLIKNEHQISNGFEMLIQKSNLFIIKNRWHDIGDEKKYRTFLKKFDKYDFSKTDEMLFFLDKKVVKFFSEAKIVNHRYKRSVLNQKVFPKINIKLPNFYSYNFIKGKTLYEEITLDIFKEFLNWLKRNLWIKKKSTYKFIKGCKLFYKDKTFYRVELFYKKYPNYDIKKINDQPVSDIYTLLNKLNWEEVVRGLPYFIHGDLQFDNVIRISKNNFKLIDWRQDFSGLLNVGDIYYDLAKMYGGILLNYDLIKKNKFKYLENNNKCQYSYYTRKENNLLIKIYDNFLIRNNFNINRVNLIVSLIYLNMAPLHNFPFDKMLFAHGRKLLNNYLSLITK